MPRLSTRLGVVAVVGSLSAVTAGVATASTAPVAPVAVAALRLAPTPIAAPGTLGAGKYVTVTVTATGAAGAVDPGASLYVSFAAAAGGGTLTSAGVSIGTTAVLRKTSTSGTLTLSYRAPATIPSSGTDTITVANAATGATVSAADTYTFTSPSADDWPQFHLDPSHQGVSGDTAISASHAPSLALGWSTSIASSCPTSSCATTVSSPAVAYDPIRKIEVLYTADYWGDLFAFNAGTGAQLWKRHVGGKILGSPAVYGGQVFIGSANDKMFEVNASTGAITCSLNVGGIITSAPAVEAINGVTEVFFGDHGPTWDTNHTGHMWAMNAAGCVALWSYNQWGSPPGNPAMANNGEWAEPGVATTRSGEHVVVFGTTDPDDEIYQLDAVTGHLNWQFQTLQGLDTDVGAGPTISAPGVNGFADGVVYETGKDKIVNALDLSTGAVIWQYNIKTANVGVTQGDTVSVAALDGVNLILGWGAGVYDLNAVTGAVIWKVSGLPEVAASPSISGPPGDQVILVGDLGGTLHAYSMTGQQLWSYSTGGVIFASTAVAHGTVYVTDTGTETVYAFH